MMFLISERDYMFWREIFYIKVDYGGTMIGNS